MSEPLFDVAPIRRAMGKGPAEAALAGQVKTAREEGRLADVDAPLIEAALIAARALDTADRIGGLKGGYLTAQSLPGYQKVLHALRLPTEVGPPTASAPPPDSQTSTPDWLRDAFGSPE